MKIKKFQSIQELLDTNLKLEYFELIENLRRIIKDTGGKERLQRNCLMYKFPNKIRVYINTYPKKFPILGISHVHKIISKNPMLDLIFDKKEKFVGKIFLKNDQIIEQKGLKIFLEYLKKFEI